MRPASLRARTVLMMNQVKVMEKPYVIKKAHKAPSTE